jgi:hypothetical protein
MSMAKGGYLIHLRRMWMKEHGRKESVGGGEVWKWEKEKK